MSNHSMTAAEVWKDIVGYEGRYQVSNFGRVKSKARIINNGKFNYRWPEKILKIGSGQLVMLCKNGKVIGKLVSRLVLEAFVGRCPDGMQCCHFPNRDRANNRLDNLMWGTPAENQGHRKIHETDVVGERNGRAKLTEGQVRRLREMFSTGKHTYADLGRRYGIEKETVARIVKRKLWKHVE